MVGQNKGENYAMNKILIIDDDRELCALIKRSVQSENIEADFCTAGKEGLQKLKEQEYQLVVLDVMMPGMDGFETLEELLVLFPSFAATLVLISKPEPHKNWILTDCRLTLKIVLLRRQMALLNFRQRNLICSYTVQNIKGKF